jgi:hypothetical protein
MLMKVQHFSVDLLFTLSGLVLGKRLSSLQHLMLAGSLMGNDISDRYSPGHVASANQMKIT